MDIGAWRARGNRITLGGRGIFYVDGPARENQRGTVLLIHGFPTSSWDWHKIWPALNRDYRLVALDLLGFGYSDKPGPHDYSIHEQADLCEALVDRLDLGEFHVLAHDYGDTVAQEMLARQNAGAGSGLWQSCLFLNGGLFPETHRALLAQRLLQGPLGFLVRHALGRRGMRRSFDRVFGPDTRASESEMDAFWELFTHDDGRRNLHRLIQYMRDRKQHRERWIAALREAICPIGLINGSVDPVSGEHMVQRFTELIGEDHFIRRLPRIGHYPQIEAPAEVAQGYLEFIGSAGV